MEVMRQQWLGGKALDSKRQEQCLVTISRSQHLPEVAAPPDDSAPGLERPKISATPTSFRSPRGTN